MWHRFGRNQKSNYANIALTPGGDGSKMNFAWLSSIKDNKPQFEIGRNADLSDAVSLNVESELTALALYSNKVTAEQLKPDTVYYYSYTVNGVWQTAQSFITSDLQTLRVLFVSDPQIGRSGDSGKDEVLISDSYGWYSTLYTSVDTNGPINMILSAGDQVEEAISSKQYNSLLAAPMLRNIPLAAAIGNHDFYFPLYKYHFNNPNEYIGEKVHSIAGHSYWFTNSGVLFVVLDSNNILSTENESIINQAVSSCPDVSWRVVMMHHSIYSVNSGEKNSTMRAYFAPLFEKYDIDLVLSGHDHNYSRSYKIKNSRISDDGVIFLSAGSASGSNLGHPRSDVPSFAACAPDIDSATYTVLDFGRDSIELRSFRTDTNECFDEYTLTNSSHSGEIPAVSSLLSRVINIIIAGLKGIFS